MNRGNGINMKLQNRANRFAIASGIINGVLAVVVVFLTYKSIKTNTTIAAIQEQIKATNRVFLRQGLTNEYLIRIVAKQDSIYKAELKHLKLKEKEYQENKAIN